MQEQSNQQEFLSEGDYDKITFYGQGATYFGIVALNVILTLITLGLYYPWAKAAYRKYIWNETEFKDSRFVFNGTGKEMFKGFLIAYGLFIAFYASIAMTAFVSFGWIFIVLFYILMLFLIPFAVFGAWRYRVSRTSWRGIFFEFDGDLREFIKLFVKDLLLSIITLGIYGPWMHVHVQKYLFTHTRIGDLRLDFDGDGATLLGINIVGVLLSIITLYLYLPIFIKDRFQFFINNTSLSDGNNKRFLKSTLTGGTAWGILFTNMLMIVFTLGLAFPWVFMRTMRMYFDHSLVPDDFNFDNLAQSSKNYKDATGDEMSDILDIGFDF